MAEQPSSGEMVRAGTAGTHTSGWLSVQGQGVAGLTGASGQSGRSVPGPKVSSKASEAPKQSAFASDWAVSWTAAQHACSQPPPRCCTVTHAHAMRGTTPTAVNPTTTSAMVTRYRVMLTVRAILAFNNRNNTVYFIPKIISLFFYSMNPCHKNLVNERIHRPYG